MTIETILKRDRALILSGIAAITALSWAYMFFLVWQMNQTMGMPEIGMSSSAMTMPQMNAWSAVEFFLMFVMWAVMMVAMMLPSATPMILSYAKISRQNQSKQGIIGLTTLFVLSYILVWVGFSLTAAGFQWLLHRLALLSPMMETSSLVLGSILLIAAGVFQFSALKYRCLQHCRVPFSFFLHEWRAGAMGALQMGAKHGTFCLGCCWILMLLLFVAGVMNLLWVATLAVLVLLEKVLPFGLFVSRVAGGIFIMWGLWLLVGPMLS